MNHFEPFLLGFIAMGNFVIALFFLRFFVRTTDRLFLFFAIAFFILGVDRCALVYVPSFSETGTVIYLLRLAAFGLILFAIVDKNRGTKGPNTIAPQSP